jgi:hypothetical protein
VSIVNDAAYTEARILGRLSKLPSEQDWSYLNPVNDYAHFLASARATPLGPWVQLLQPDDGAHAIERRLRARYLAEVETLSHWTVEGTEDAVAWCRYLPYLGVIEHLAREGEVYSWMREDPFLDAWISGEDRGGLSDTFSSPLAADVGIRELWLAGLRSRLPASLVESVAGNTLLERVSLALHMHPVQAGVAEVAPSLRSLLHRYLDARIMLPVYLVLFFWMLERLQAELISRRIFEARVGFA